MIRRIVEIDQEKCNGCGACAKACHEGAIGMINGKATLLKDDYCDGLGDCLPACPTGAISFIEREAAAYDEAAVKARMAAKKKAFTGCPGTKMQNLSKSAEAEAVVGQKMPSRLMQWPCQIKLAPTNAPYFDNADLLIAADCTAFAYANMHEEFMRGRITLVGCPKLDNIDYSEKLAMILATNDIRSITLVRMEVPCCGGLNVAVKKAMEFAECDLPSRVVTISLDGKILDDSVL